jgi:hypothetical protein
MWPLPFRLVDRWFDRFQSTVTNERPRFSFLPLLLGKKRPCALKNHRSSVSRCQGRRDSEILPGRTIGLLDFFPSEISPLSQTAENPTMSEWETARLASK